MISFVLDLLKQASDMLTAATVRLTPVLQENMLKFTKGSNTEASTGSLSKGFKSAMTLATSYTAQGGDRGEEEEGGADRDIEDPYGVAAMMQVFNTVEMCIRYTDRLNRDITKAGETVFSIPLGEGKTCHVICIIFFYVIIEVTLILIH